MSGDESKQIDRETDQVLVKAIEALDLAEKKDSEISLSLDEQGLVQGLKGGKYKSIILMVGAGISVNAGIPDFRTPGSGLYSNLQKFNLPYPEAIFDLNYFRTRPEPFYELAKDLHPGQGRYNPTRTHYFVKYLVELGLVQRVYTQNIDGLERLAGIDSNLIVEAHGSFATASCISCKTYHPPKFVLDHMKEDQIPLCRKCEQYVKPDIVFFSEALPSRFHECLRKDMEQCDLLLVAGTSLTVYPFASLVHLVPSTCVRVLINREVVGERKLDEIPSDDEEEVVIQVKPRNPNGFRFGAEDNQRDIFLQGDCDDVIQRLSEQLEWHEHIETYLKKNSDAQE